MTQIREIVARVLKSRKKTSLFKETTANMTTNSPQLTIAPLHLMICFSSLNLTRTWETIIGAIMSSTKTIKRFKG